MMNGGDRGYDGPTLRAMRENFGVPLRRIARLSGISHGHLSKMERGEPGRPVTHTVLLAYEKGVGVPLVGTAGHRSDQQPGWRRGQVSEQRMLWLRGKLAAVAAGAPVADTVARTLDATGQLIVPSQVEQADIAQLDVLASALTAVDMRYGGGVADQSARALLRWAAKLLETGVSGDLKPGLHAAIATMAQCAGWAAFDADDHEVARTLFSVGLSAAARADDPDLRAHLVADFAAQHNYLGYPADSLYMVRQAEVDERVGPAIRMVICCVKARAYAMRGDGGSCWAQISLAEREQAIAPGTGWQATVATIGQLHAGCGHALATLARRTGDTEARTLARDQLVMALDELHPERKARASALCLAQLAALQLEAGVVDEGVH